MRADPMVERHSEALGLRPAKFRMRPCESTLLTGQLAEEVQAGISEATLPSYPILRTLVVRNPLSPRDETS
jgi:hypothetical protein